MLCLHHPLSPPDSFDEPWKAILEHYFPAFLSFFFPSIAAAIDWSRPHDNLTPDLLRISPTSAIGNRSVDWLVRVWLRSGEEYWLLIHIEIQSQTDRDFPYRVAIYQFRLRLQYNRSVVTLAVLGDDDPIWRPTRYVDEQLGMRVELQFPMVKLLDYRDRDDELRASPNPMALLVRAHLATLDTRHDALRRKAVKLGLFRDLLRMGSTSDEVRQLMSLLDWFMNLPEDLYTAFWNDVETTIGAEAMNYLTSFERHGMQKGIQQGLQQGLQQGRSEERADLSLRLLTRKFGTLPDDVTAQIRALESEQLLALAESLLDFTTPDDLTAWLAANPPVAE